MTPQDFVAKWRASPKDERRHSQTHFNDLCALVGVPDPASAADPGFTFEKGVSKTAGGSGWADVWRRGCFGWEYKSHGRNLDDAHRQLLMYSAALENPPLLVTSDMDRIVIHTNWTNTVQEVTTLALDDLLDGARRDLLRSAFSDPERLKPRKTRQALTEEAAAQFVALAQRLRQRGHDAQTVAHFVNRLVFCMFAEDVSLLPDRLFLKMLEAARPDPASFAGHASTLFAAMRAGGLVGFQRVDWFNGGLFDDDAALPLERTDIDDLIAAARLDWSQIDPSILGTLFERGLDPGKRSQLGAHYTDRDKIMKIVTPVIVEPLLAEWAEVRRMIEARLAKAPKETKDRLLRGPDLAARTKALNESADLLRAFLDRLKGFRVLDPACGSGNFLYLALRALKDIEHRVNVEAEALGLLRSFPAVGPEAVRGIEINPYAAELARVSVWIGEIQWMRLNGYDAGRNPILRPLDTIECRDAILNEDGTRADWPAADVVIGNPPFLGSHLMRERLGDTYTEDVRLAYSSVLTAKVNFVTYWFAQVLSRIEQGHLQRFGLVATNAIRQRDNRQVIAKLLTETHPMDIYSDEEWVLDGAAVRVSIITGSRDRLHGPTLDGHPVGSVSSDLRDSSGGDLSRAERLRTNLRRSFFGYELAGQFTVDGTTARRWLLASNPHGVPNTAVLFPLASGKDITERWRDNWVIDFNGHDTEFKSSLFEKPFQSIIHAVKSRRISNRRDSRKKYWWLFGETRPALRRALSNVDRYICTVERAKHRFFVFLPRMVAADRRLIIFPTDCSTFLGIVSSHIHVVWALALGSFLEDRPGYNTGVCFDTFPFPEGLTPDIPASAYADDPRARAIAAAAAELDRLRQAWLDPPDLIRRQPEVVPGYPDRILPVDDEAAEVLKKRTLTNLYNQRPAWLDHAHRALDAAVADAYGWGGDWRAGRLGDDTILARLFALNQARAAAAPPSS